MTRHRNKYQEKARDARERGKVERSCLSKQTFNSPVEAAQNGMRVYQCPYCNLWHRTSKRIKW